VVASASGWSVGMGIAVANAGTGGNTELISSVTNIAGTTFTLNDAAVTTATGQTVNHDDTAAISSAITAAIAANKPLHLQAGSYNVTSGLTAVSSPLTFLGDGKTQSIIWNRSKTAVIFTVNYQYNFNPPLTTQSALFQNFGVSQASGITPTAGGAFLIGSATSCSPCTTGAGSLFTSDVTLQNVAMSGLWSGVATQNGLIRDWFLNLSISQGVGGCGINYNSPKNGGDNHWNDIEMTGGSTALCIVASDTQTFQNIKTNGGAGVVFSGAAATAINRVRFVNPSIEGTGTLPSCAFDFGANGATQVTIIGGEVGGIPNVLCNSANVTGGLAIGGLIQADASFTANGVLNVMKGLPTSSAGLASGTVWSNSNVLNVVP